MNIQHIKHFSIKILCSLLFILTFTTGCGTDAERGNKEDAETADTKVPVAVWEGNGKDFQGKQGLRMIGDTLFYMENEWESEKDSVKVTDTCIYRLRRGESDPELIADFNDAELVYYLVDEAEAVYFLYAEGNGNVKAFHLKKVDRNGLVQYDVPLSHQQEDRQEEAVQRIGTVVMGEASREGEVCLSNPSGDLFLFDADGQLTCLGSTDWKAGDITAFPYHGGRCGLVNAGGEGLFTYTIDGRKVLLRKISMEDGTLEAASTVEAEGQNGVSLTVYNGYDMGVLIADSDSLWNYRIHDKELTQLLGWGDSTINLKGYSISTIGILPDKSLYISACETYDNMTFLHIDSRLLTDIQEKQVITLAVLQSGLKDFEEMVSAFNRRSEEYRVELSPFSSNEDAHLQLLKGEGPDLFGLHLMDISTLARNGVLENLSPYFTESKIVTESDLLPSILRAMETDGAILCVLPTFQAEGYLVEKGTTDNGGWTVEEFLALGERNPGSSLVWSYSSPADILEAAIEADMDSYVNWKEKECDFDSGRFISLVDRVNDLEEPPEDEVTAALKHGQAEAAMEALNRKTEQLLQGEILTGQFGVYTLLGYQQRMEEYGGFMENAGYPNQSGEPCYKLSAITSLGMNSASEYKEGAWAFLEFLLSEEYQDTLESMPVRKDSFDRYVMKDETLRGVKINLSDEDREFIRFMVDNAYWLEGSGAQEITRIIHEETKAVWAGDKTAKEAAQIIQNRVLLYLNE